METEVVDLDASSSDCSGELQSVPSLNFIYPAGALDSVKITEADIDTLDRGQYVNDNIINFYLRFLVLAKHPAASVHVFNSFFYQTLVTPGSATLNYERVQSWTKRVNLFEKESLIVPIIQNQHWRLAIVGNPGEMFRDSDPEKQPYIVCFDSFIAGHDPIVSSVLVEYLRLEWESRFGETDAASVSELQMIHPMQDNETDCGLFVLEFAEKYLEEREAFQEAACNGCTLDRSMWFQCEDAASKRAHLKWLIRFLSDGRPLSELKNKREVYFLVPLSLFSTRRRKRRRLPLEEDFEPY